MGVVRLYRNPSGIIVLIIICQEFEKRPSSSSTLPSLLGLPRWY